MIRVAKPKKQKAQAGPVNAGRLKSFVERVEKLEEERKAIGDDVRDVYAEAHGIGYDKKTIRWMVRERKVDSTDRDERDSLRITYAHALGMAVDAVSNGEVSLRQAEGKYGVSKSSIHRALPVPEVSQVEMTDGDLWADGVIIEDAAPGVCVDGIPAPTVAAPVVPHASTLQTAEATTLPVTPVPDGGVGAGTIPDAVARAVARDTMLAMEEAAVPTPSVGAVAEPSAAQRVATTVTHVSTMFAAAPAFVDDLTFPAHLRRVPA